jgi:hypothetical protein
MISALTPAAPFSSKTEQIAGTERLGGAPRLESLLSVPI